jgi:hypothetical protein
MAVTVDATATVATAAAALTITNSSLTVGAGATALLAMLCFDENALTPTAIACKWDNAGTPQTMTLITSRQSTNSNIFINLFGLVNPTAGNKNLTATWTGSVPSVLGAQSYNGSISASVATAFLHANTNLGLASAPSLTITSAVGNMAVACDAAVTTALLTLTATSSTNIFGPTSFGVGTRTAQAARAPGASSVVWAGTPASVSEWAIAGVDIAAPLTTVAFPRWPDLIPVRHEMVSY